MRIYTVLVKRRPNRLVDAGLAQCTEKTEQKHCKKMKTSWTYWWPHFI